MLRRQTLYPTELRAHPWLLAHSTAVRNYSSSTLRDSWSTWSRYIKSDAHDLCFPKTGRKVFVQSGIEFAHRFCSSGPHHFM